MEVLALTLPFHQRDAPLGSDVVDVLKARPRVRIFNVERLWAHHNFGLFVHDGLGEKLGFVFLESKLVLFARVTVLRLSLADIFKGEHGLFELSQCDISLTLSVVTFDVLWVELDCLTGIKQG